MDSQSRTVSLRHIDVMREAVRSWLSDVRRRERSVRDLEHRIAEARARVTGLRGIDYTNMGPSGSGGHDAMQEGIAAIEELCTEWSEAVAHAAESIAEAYEVMDACSTPGYAVMRHCLLGETWAEVGRSVGYSERSVRLMSGNGYAEVWARMPEQARRDAFPNCDADLRESLPPVTA
ncbi:hypothetical protein VJ923_06135 [Adlercreutzia sp. R25]|uniref:Sigma-70 family RNA polymerase sigma factor n=1 Tax=Adlercreutzia shanghongiae TaxID=3111773 RepID=A0ABU6IX48_9ACTN|nr:MULTISPECIES: hypothetical protein [unclassified Adlercreutzia]MEC4272731.1 hypothetical protein [Adlercreutzia sp. R25]MEC4294370.1 hypothetical protein [Adlercreutzia sp. R22]